MAKIYITGHRNPDMDSVCSAYAYAYLKNRIDSENEYIPVRCGNLNDSTKAAFERLSITPPLFMKDVKTRLGSIVQRGEATLDANDPVYNLTSLFTDHPTVVSLLEGDQFYNLLSIDDVNNFFLRESSSSRPLYHFVVENIPKVIRGWFYRKGRVKFFTGPVAVGAMKFKAFCAFMDKLEQPPLVVVGNREDHIKLCIEKQVPVLILTGCDSDELRQIDFTGFEGTVFLSEHDTSETLRLLRLSVPIKQVIRYENLPEMDSQMLFDEARNFLTQHRKFRGLPVFENGKWIGYVTRLSFLNRPQYRVILVDHNEPEQSIRGLDEAKVVEIIDHHRLGALKTSEPIFILCDPVGSTCTIVYHLFERYRVEIPPSVAAIILSGITSDTVLLKSPTTTVRDREAVARLCEIAGVEDYEAFGRTLFESGPSLESRDPVETVKSDFKIYTDVGRRFGIGQFEVLTLANVDQLKERFFTALKKLRESMNLDFAFFLITDVIHQDSVLLTSGFDIYEPMFAYQNDGRHKFLLPGVLSRKKQLLPEILRVLEEN